MSIPMEVVTTLRDLVGHDSVLDSQEALNTTSQDTWPVVTKEGMLDRYNYRGDLLVKASSFDEVPRILALATEHGIPVTVRALASSVTGQPLPVKGGIVLDVSNIPASFEVNERNMTVTATASMHGGELQGAMMKQGYTLGHSPQSLYRSTVGGWVATLATGQFSSMYGGIEDLLTAYTVILATGEEVELKASPRAAMGPDLRGIFIGSEGTLGIVTSVTLKLFPFDLPTEFATYELPSVEAGIEFMREQALLGLNPFLVRLYDTDEARHAMVDNNFPSPVCFIGSRGPQAIVDAEMTTMDSIMTKLGGKNIGTAGVDGWMGRRFDFSTVENLLAEPGGFAETVEVAHNWDGIEGLYAALKAALEPLADEVLSHFSHVYTQGTSMYVILLGRAESDEAAVERLHKIWETAMAVCLEHGAELSHHHGGGLARSPYAERSLGSAHLVLKKLKAALDPAGILNPGKLGL